MINKIVGSSKEVVKPIPDGASIMIGGFGGSGVPHALINALAEQGSSKLTVICNGVSSCGVLAENNRIQKLICSFASWTWRSKQNPLVEPYLAGELDVELVPQGTLAERIRAGGYGIEAFYTDTGVGTEVAEGKEVRIFGDKECVLEPAIKADFALIKAYKADRWGNLVYRMTSRNFNPLMATAAKVTIAQVEEIVELGELEPEVIITPGIFVNGVIRTPKEPSIWMYRPIQQQVFDGLLTGSSAPER